MKNKIAILVLLFFLFKSYLWSDEQQLRPEMITVEAEKSIERGLQYLVKNQSRDGSWRTNGASGGYPCAMTALAGLAILASGSTPLEGPYAINVQKATEYLLSCAGESGVIAKMSEEQRSMYGHGFAMLFLGQVIPIF